MMSIPKYFCWTKFGVEAGEPIGDIIQRKERERIENGGTFLWGIGNALGPSIVHLLKLVRNPEIIFSPIKSPPKAHDVSPEQVVMWKQGLTLDGELYNLPHASYVTSRATTGQKRSHYALVCQCSKELNLDMNGELIQYKQLRNLRTGKPIGYSQVTSVVMKEDILEDDSLLYAAAMRAKLVFPYFVRLVNPIAVRNKDQVDDPSKRTALAENWA